MITNFENDYRSYQLQDVNILYISKLTFFLLKNVYKKENWFSRRCRY